MEPKAGSFCWLELATTDRNEAKSFYSSLFGWTAQDVPDREYFRPGEDVFGGIFDSIEVDISEQKIPIPPEMIYTICRLGANEAAGIQTRMKDQLDAHVAPHWMLYIKVDDADAVAEKSAALGGRMIVPPGYIPKVGRFAVLQDPTGAAISLFQPGQHRGITNVGEVGALCWADLNSTDPGAAANYYGGLFGWTFEGGEDDYRHIVNGSGPESMIGGIPSRMHRPPETPSHWLSYFRVADCQASLAKAVQRGARTLMSASPIPDVGMIAVLADPQGAVFALYQSMQKV